MTALDDALNSSAVTFDQPSLTADWVGLLPGYATLVNPLDSIRDLGQQLGGVLQISHSLDDGLPDPVTMTTGNEAAGVLSADLIGRPANKADLWGTRASTSGTGTGTTITTTLPTAVAFGDYVVVAIAVSSAVAVTVPDESFPWQLLGTISDGALTIHAYGRQHYQNATALVATLASSASFSWVTAGFWATTAAGTLVDVNPGTVATFAESVTGTSHTIPSATLAGRGWFLSAWSASSGSALWSAGSGDTELAEVAATTDLALMLSAFQENPVSRSLSATTSSSTGTVAALGIPMRVMDRPEMDGKKYFSPFNAASPIQPFDRDTAPVTASVNVVTANGVEGTQIFKGQMLDVPVSGRTPNLQAVSKTRILLNKSVQLPTVSGRREGCSVDWLATWLMSRGSQFVGPAVNRYTRYWAPLYGSMHAHFEGPFSYNGGLLYNPPGPPGGPYGLKPPTSVEGPFLTGMYAQQSATRTEEIFFQSGQNMHDMPIGQFPHVEEAGGPHEIDIFSQASSKGRMCFWLRADAVTHNPSYLDTVQSYLWDGKVYITDRYGVILGWVRMGIDSANRRAFVHMGSDAGGYGTVTYGASGLLPTDGEWHFWGFYWDFAAGEARVILDGTESISTFWSTIGANATAQLPTTDQQGLNQQHRYRLFVSSHIPMSDFIYDCGMPYGASFWDDQRLANVAPAKTATMRPTNRKLAAIAEPLAVNAWDTLAELAETTLSAYRVNEQDNIEFLPMSYFGEAAQLTPSAVASTETNASELNVTQDPSKIRNTVTVQFKETREDTQPQPVYELSSAITIPRGTTEITFALDVPIAEIHGASGNPLNGTLWLLANLTSAQITSGPLPVGFHWFTPNTAEDGSGTYLTAPSAMARIIGGDSSSITVRFTNSTSSNYYIANNGNSVPFLRLLGYGVRVNDGYSTKRDEANVARRGERSLEAALPWVQSRADAEELAITLAAALAQPRPQVTVTVMGDPRRKPGQLVTLLDAEGTAAEGTWRVLTVDHGVSGPRYTQDLGLVRVLPAAVWDGPDGWDQSIWSE